MKITIKPENYPLLDWLDAKAKQEGRSRGQQVLWFLKRLKRVDICTATLVHSEFFFVDKANP